MAIINMVGVKGGGGGGTPGLMYTKFKHDSWRIPNYTRIIDMNYNGKIRTLGMFQYATYSGYDCYDVDFITKDPGCPFNDSSMTIYSRCGGGFGSYQIYGKDDNKDCVIVNLPHGYSNYSRRFCIDLATACATQVCSYGAWTPPSGFTCINGPDCLNTWAGGCDTVIDCTVSDADCCVREYSTVNMYFK